jgi:hypothetical protein
VTLVVIKYDKEKVRRRLEAERSGQRFMSYGEAGRRLRKVLASAAGAPVPELMQQVFEG